MAQYPAMPLWTDAYLGDTTHLTTLEHGAYFLLIMALWRAPDRRLPNDPKLLARYAKLTLRQWGRIESVMRPFFTLSEDQEWITQLRVLDEWNIVSQRSATQSAKARARWHKSLNGHGMNGAAGYAAADATADAAGIPPTPTPTPTQVSKKTAPKHGQRDKTGKRVFFHVDTFEFKAHAEDFRQSHQGGEPTLYWNGTGSWFNWHGEPH